MVSDKLARIIAPHVADHPSHREVATAFSGSEWIIKTRTRRTQNPFAAQDCFSRTIESTLNQFIEEPKSCGCVSFDNLNMLWWWASLSLSLSLMGMKCRWPASQQRMRTHQRPHRKPSRRHRHIGPHHDQTGTTQEYAHGIFQAIINVKSVNTADASVVLTTWWHRPSNAHRFRSMRLTSAYTEFNLARSESQS